MQKHLFCFGLGYVATELAKELIDEGWKVSGTTRSEDKLLKLKQLGIDSYIFGNEDILHRDITHILHSIPPSKEGDIVLNKYGKLIENSDWLGYLSTTGVYGNHDGNWVDENTDTTPNNDRSKYRVIAENNWLNKVKNSHIFRLSGIYGLLRNNFISLKEGSARRIDKKNQFFSRIHVDDIVQTLIASINKPNPGSIYNLADDLPCPQEEVVKYAADLLNITPPPLVSFEEANLSEMARSFYSSSRKVKNDKIKTELGVKLKFPTYKEGLNNILEKM